MDSSYPRRMGGVQFRRTQEDLFALVQASNVPVPTRARPQRIHWWAGRWPAVAHGRGATGTPPAPPVSYFFIDMRDRLSEILRPPRGTRV